VTTPPELDTDWLVEPTPEMTRWARRLGGLLRPGSLAGMLLVTPIAHVANGSFGFQSYLYDVFHRSTVARIGHALCMPLIVAAAFGLVFSFATPVAVACALALAGWHARSAARAGLPGLGAAMVAVVAALAAGGAVWASIDTPWWAHPGLHVLVLGLAQTLTHAGEAHVPPRVSGDTRWVPTRAFFAAHPVRHGLRSAVMVVAGMANEIWASWRLLHLVVLDGLFALGYRRDIRAAREAVVRDACADDNPAIDFIGRGGAAVGPW